PAALTAPRAVGRELSDQPGRKQPAADDGGWGRSVPDRIQRYGAGSGGQSQGGADDRAGHQAELTRRVLACEGLDEEGRSPGGGRPSWVVVRFWRDDCLAW